jgi:hypothetical protein
MLNSSVEEHVPEEELQGLSLRAIIFGCIGILLFMAAYIRTSVLKLGHPMELEYTPSAPGGSFIIIGLLINFILGNTQVKRYFKQSELMVVYIMVMVSSVITEALRHFYAQIPLPNYLRDIGGSYGSVYENLKLERISPLLIPQGEEALIGFYMGRSSVPWGAWVMPILLWSLFFIAFVMAAMCLATFVRRRWIEVDRLTFPLAIPITEMTDITYEEPMGKMWKDGAIRLGLIIPIIYYGLNILNTYFPAVPSVSFNYDFRPFFTTPEASWVAGAFTAVFQATPLSVGILYQVPNDLLGSALIFAVIWGIRLRIMTIFDGPRNGPLLWATNAENAIGTASWGFFLLWLCRDSIKAKFKSAFKKDLTPSEEALLDPDPAMSDKLAILGLIVSYIFLVAFLDLLVGIPTGLGLLYFGVIFGAMVGFARMGAEAGVFSNKGAVGYWEEALGISGVSPDSAPILAGYFGGTICASGVLPVLTSMTLHSYKMSEDSHMKARGMSKAILVASVLTTLVLPLFLLPVAYNHGAPDYLGKAAVTYGWVWNQRYRVARITYPILYLVSGVLAAAFVWFLMFMRMRFVWWPLHPYAYLASSRMTTRWWGSMLVAWLVKSLAMRWGGRNVRESVRRFFLGMMVGSLMMEALRIVVGIIFV